MGAVQRSFVRVQGVACSASIQYVAVFASVVEVAKLAKVGDVSDFSSIHDSAKGIYTFRDSGLRMSVKAHPEAAWISDIVKHLCISNICVSSSWRQTSACKYKPPRDGFPGICPCPVCESMRCPKSLLHDSAVVRY